MSQQFSQRAKLLQGRELQSQGAFGAAGASTLGGPRNLPKTAEIDALPAQGNLAKTVFEPQPHGAAQHQPPALIALVAPAPIAPVAVVPIGAVVPVAPAAAQSLGAPIASRARQAFLEPNAASYATAQPAVARPASVAPNAPQLAPGASANGAQKSCKRCSGVSDRTSQFCKFCGTPFDERDGGPQPIGDLTARGPRQAPAGESVQPRPLAAPAPNESVGAGHAPMQAASPTNTQSRPVETGRPSALATAAHSRGRIVVIAKDGSEGATYPLTERTDIGRTEGTLRFGDDGYLSPRHAAIEFRGAEVVLRDLDSVNGVYLRLRADADPSGTPIGDYDQFLIGQQVLRLEIGPTAAPNVASEHGTLVFGTPAAERFGRVVSRSVDATSMDVYYLRRTEIVLGRENGDIVFPDDLFLSRRHAALRFAPAQRTFRLSDLGSSNGTFLKLRAEARLRHLDEFRVGQQLLRIELQSSKAST